MDFIDKLKALSVRVQTHAPKVQTEEATKTALILPFLSVLGYDVFDPAEVVPEYIADVAQKRGREGGLCHLEGWGTHHHPGVQARRVRLKLGECRTASPLLHDHGIPVRGPNKRPDLQILFRPRRA